MGLGSGDRLGPYEIRDRIGAGGMGEVYRAIDTRLRRSVAIKVLPENVTSATSRARLEREAQAVAALSHPNVLSVFDVGTEGDVFYIVTELLEGRSLRELLSGGAPGVGVAIDLARQAAAALHSAHSSGIIHRDIKPENLFVMSDGRLKVLDFGLARLVASADQETAVHEPQLTAANTIVGTIGYMSPEQLRGVPFDHRSDLFSLGCVLYEMLSGRPPFQRSSQTATIAAILHDSPDYAPLTTIPASLLAIVQRCLAKEPEARYHSAGELAAALQTPSDAPVLVAPIASDAPTVTMSLDPGTVARTLPSRRRLRTAAVAVLVILPLLIAATLWVRRQPGEALSGAVSRKRQMIAVLPFQNLGGDREQEYFTAGLTEDTTTEFGRISPDRLGVIARTSAIRYKETTVDVRTIGRELGVDYVVQGSVRRTGDRVRVAAQLIRTADAVEMWAESYDRTVDDVLAIQAELARGVASAVRVQVAPARTRPHRTAGPVTPAGRDAFLRGRHHLALGTAKDRVKAVELLELALVSDPNSALLHSELARALLSMSTIDYPPHEVVPKARIAVEKALQLDETLAEAHDTFATMLLEYYWDWPAAERESSRAIELDPNFARARAVHATLLVSAGRGAEGMEEARRARALDPVAPAQHRNFLLQLFSARRWDEALEQSRKVIELDPKYDLAFAVAGLAHLARNETGPAVAAADKVLATSKVPVPRAIAAYIHARTGREESARELVKELEAAAEKRFVCFFNVATVYAALGEKDKAFDALERAIRDRSG